MTRSTARTSARTIAAGLGLAALLVGGPALAGTSTTTLPNGADLSATVTSPETGDRFLVAPGDSGVDVPLTGTASIGLGAPDVTWIYVVDVSGSTDAVCGTATIVECEKVAVSTLNSQVVADGSALEAGLAIFADGSTTADISSAGGDQLLTDPSDPDVDTAIDSISVGGIGQHTARTVSSGFTNFAAGLDAANTISAAASGGTVNVVFLSDGDANTGGQASFDAELAAFGSNVSIYPFAVGSSATCDGSGPTGSPGNGTLDQMAAATGTECALVPDPTDLPDVITNVIATRLLEVTVTVDGVEVPATVSPTPPQPGPISVDWDATALDLAPGLHEVCVTAEGEGPIDQDPADVASVTQCETISVFAFDVTPPDAINELGVDDTHTVTATVSGPAGELAGWPVDFAIVAGPNAGDSGTCDPADCTTDASGQVTFTYTVPIEPDSLGTDTISGTVDIDGTTGTVEVSKLWQDTTPPVAACPEGPNPGGKTPKAPGKGGQGQNQDGFYHLEATDDVWPDEDLEVYVTDTGTGTVFGPFANGDDIKYTEANGATPSVKPGPGQVEWRIKGQGDAQVTAVDGSGNVSDPVDCLVPNPPK
ncbi:vWA domain-containing protein [Salsipaludibacter albus]|uniref:vWA domain-containing protein n=1 Tax=Salsipaludibacter albus TaxID=2849650 RepID=UPI001EE433EC|nr:vWA domain-containing protein [Salsipaludibacter albus]MBY5163022.1 VWA domain-containing protein [Salsipaludibacter albus]